MSSLDKKEKLILVILGILLFSSKGLYLLSGFTYSKILFFISIVLKGLFFMILMWIAKTSKGGVIFIVSIAIVELFVAIYVFCGVFCKS